LTVEFRKRIDELAGSGYIAGPSHVVPFDPILVEAMNQEIDTYGRAVYLSLRRTSSHGTTPHL
jgi:hypothetical protein